MATYRRVLGIHRRDDADTVDRQRALLEEGGEAGDVGSGGGGDAQPQLQRRAEAHQRRHIRRACATDSVSAATITT